MPKTKTQMTISLNILLDETTGLMLDHLVNHTGQTKAAILRNAIVVRYTHEIAGHPTCPTGRQCFVPHLFQQAPTAPIVPPLQAAPVLVPPANNQTLLPR